MFKPKPGYYNVAATVCQELQLLPIVAASREVNRNAVDLAFRKHGKKHGSKPSYILTIHGLLGSKRNWQTISEKFAETQKSIVLAVDLRNHGESPHTKTHTYPELAADVSQLLDKQKIKEATIIGHSMGGRTAMVLALTQPKKVKRLIVVDISPISTPGLLSSFFPTLMNAMKSVNVNPDQSISEARKNTRQALSKVVDDVNALSFILLNIGSREGKMGWMCNIDTLKKEIGNIAKFPLSLYAGKVYEGPTLFIGGSLSSYIPIGDLPQIQKLFPSVKLEYIENVGHNVHAENPTAFHNAVSKFIAEN